MPRKPKVEKTKRQLAIEAVEALIAETFVEKQYMTAYRDEMGNYNPKLVEVETYVTRQIEHDNWAWVCLSQMRHLIKLLDTYGNKTLTEQERTYIKSIESMMVLLDESIGKRLNGKDTSIMRRFSKALAKKKAELVAERILN